MTLATSRKQVPVCIKKLHELVSYPLDGATVLNFGCGKWPELSKEYLKSLGVAKSVHYDPNLKVHPVGIDDYEAIKDEFYDVVVVANTLNVIREAVLLRTMEQLAALNTGTYIIQIYEGDKSGNGRDTRDGYQRNCVVGDYLPNVLGVINPHSIEIRGNVMIVHKT